MSEENVRLVKRLDEEVFNQGRLDAADELLAPDFVDHNPMPDTPSGPEGMKRMAENVRSWFSDPEVVDEELIASGDKVVHRWRQAYSHSGEFMGIPATGQRVEIEGIEIWRVADGKLAERWGLVDAVGILAQLGAVPGAAAPA